MNAAGPAIEDVAAVVLEYHRPDATLRCIKSLSEAGIKDIFIWNNSTDSGKTSDMLGMAITKDEQLYGRVSIEGDNINLGFSAGVNAAISRISKTRPPHYILLINNDATINSEGVSALLKALKSDEKHAIAAPRYLNVDKRNRALMYYHPFLATLTKRKYPGSFAFLSGCCLLVDIEKAGMPLLDEEFFMYGEDVALSWKLQRKGYKLTIAESASVEHIGAASSVVGSVFYEYHVARGHVLLTTRIVDPGLYAFLLWPPRIFSLFARSLLRSIRSGNTTAIKALWRALFGLGPG